MNFDELYQVFVLALATAAIALTISTAKIFLPLRKRLLASWNWLGELVSCPYCLSHWIALFFIIMYGPRLIEKYFILDMLVSIFAVVAISAVFIYSIMRLAGWSIKEPESQLKDIAVLRAALEAARKKIVEQQQRIQELEK